ncbi:MAG TPA: hypothetical protein VFL41_02795 [Gaiellaceae bacterium]|nr:hypothetical protein [Gaiellaceae bacterium]
MVPREQLERHERRPSAGWALVLQAAAEQLRLLPVAELADRAIGDGALAVVRRARRALDLVLPRRAQAGELFLRPLLGERSCFGGG